MVPRTLYTKLRIHKKVTWESANSDVAIIPALGGSLHKVLRMQNTSHVALLDSLQSQRSNQCSTNTRTVLGSQDLNGVLIALVGLGGPIEDLTQGLGAAGLEVRVFVENGAVSANVGGLNILLLADGCDTTG